MQVIFSGMFVCKNYLTIWCLVSHSNLGNHWIIYESTSKGQRKALGVCDIKTAGDNIIILKLKGTFFMETKKKRLINLHHQTIDSDYS